MKFLELPTKLVLVEEELLGADFYTEEELIAIRSAEDFYSWSGGGYYRKEYRVHVVDVDAEVTNRTENRSAEDCKSEAELVELYTMRVSDRLLS